MAQVKYQAVVNQLMVQITWTGPNDLHENILSLYYAIPPS